MSRSSQQAPWNYQCPYRHACPHLEGLSTQWLWEEYQSAPDENMEHWRVRDLQSQELSAARKRIHELEHENEQLQAKFTVLHRRQFKTNKKICTQVPRTTNAAAEDKKKRGAPVGHPGWTRRTPDHIDTVVTVDAPAICPHCSGAELTPVPEIKIHLQEDIILQPKTKVTQFSHHQAFCRTCNRAVIQAAPGELLNSAIGPATKAAAVFLRYGLRIPYRKVQDLFAVFFNMPFVPASAMAFDRQATKKGGPLYDDIAQKLRCADRLHADETHWRQDGLNHFVWYGGNTDIAYFHINRHRSAEVARSIFGDSFKGVLHTDGYAAYNSVNAKVRQTCLAHLLRTAKEIKQEIVLQDPKFQEPKSLLFCDNLTELLQQACHIARQLNAGEIPRQGCKEFKHRLYANLQAICAATCASEKITTLQQRLMDTRKEYHRLFTFLDYPDVQPTNNHAEQSLRTIVIFRKICFGTRSPAGSLSHSILPSLLVTAMRQGKHPLDFFKILFTSSTTAAQAALYKNSS